MGLGSKLKNMNVFDDGASYLGIATEVTLVKLARKFEGFRAAGMDGEIDIDMGQEKLELEYTLGGLVSAALGGFGLATHDGKMVRFAGAYQADDTGLVTPVEIIVRGRHQEIDMGNAKPGADTEHKFKMSCSYYKLIVNGRDVIKIDIPGMVLEVNGVDRLAAHRVAIGL
jgi:P2 family phage contractile tail tube protein